MPAEYLDNVRRIAVIGSRHQERHLDQAGSFIGLLAAEAGPLVFETRFADYLRSHSIFPSGSVTADALPDDIDLVLSLGGDGTFLRAARWVAGRPVPVLGVNTGHLGFLSNCSISEAAGLLRYLRQGTLRKEQRMLLHLEGEGIPADVRPYALNEIAISKEDTASMITLHTRVDGYFLADYLADGLVISTPTGSTAYNLSLGGPILQPTLRNMVLVPIAPHSLTLRPIVVDGDSVIECTTTSRASHYRVSVDGSSFVVPCDTAMRISRAPFTIVTLRRPDDNFAATLRHKLHWGSR